MDTTEAVAVIRPEGLQHLVTELAAGGFTVLGPTVRDGAVVPVIPL